MAPVDVVSPVLQLFPEPVVVVALSLGVPLSSVLIGWSTTTIASVVSPTSFDFLPFFVIPVVSQWCLCLVLDCTLWLLSNAPLCKNTLFFGCVGNSGFLVGSDNVYRPFSGRNPGSSLVHNDLGCILPCVDHRDRVCSRRVVFRYTYLYALVGSGPPSGIFLLVPDRDEVLCAAPVPLVN